MEKSIGALWIKTGDKGEYWTGNIELPDGTKQNVIVFKNTYKKDNQPDFRIFKQKQKEQKGDFIPNDEEVMATEDLPF
jgi:uncharacterized protein (DUF736 family)